MKNVYVLLLSVVCCCAAAGTGHTRDKRSCAADVKKLCADVQPGGGAIVNCLKEHTAELSSECKASISKNTKESLDKKPGRLEDTACKDDIASLCKGTKGGEMVSCLKKNEDSLSSGCKTALKAGRKGKRGGGPGGDMEKNRAACAADVKKLCADITPGGGSIIKCLKENESSLSEKCKATLPKGEPPVMGGEGPGGEGPEGGPRGGGPGGPGMGGPGAPEDDM